MFLSKEICIDWSQLKDGYHGFEELAHEFIVSKYPNSTWIKTGSTRDGNKDSVAVVYGFSHKTTQSEKWWMEAKYSTENKILSRYRLDPTIVSALISGSVKKIFFVTNISIAAKTIVDIRVALNAVKCRDVVFCTKNILEYWLAQHEEIFYLYFSTPQLPEKRLISTPDFAITQEVDFYTIRGSRASFKEPTQHLYVDEPYIAYFSIYSKTSRRATLSVKNGIKGIDILSNRNIVLSAGENQISFRFVIREKYLHNKNPHWRKKDYEQREYSPVIIFKLGPIYIPSRHIVIPMDRHQKQLFIPSQKKILNNLIEDIKQYKKRLEHTPVVHYLDGISGVGKSRILEWVLEDNAIDSGDNVFICNFINLASKNHELLLELICFILFPYIEPREIDCKYIRDMNCAYTCNGLLELLEAKNKNDETLINRFMQICEADSLLPDKMDVAQRFIFIEDLHKLDTSTSKCLISLILSICRRKLPIFILLTSQPQFSFSPEFLYLNKQIVISQHVCKIRIADIIKCAAKEYFPAKNVITDKWLEALDFNAIELLFFVRELWSEPNCPENLSEFLLFCKVFTRSRILENYILGLFKNCFQQYEQPQKCQEICTSIYWSSQPYLLSDKSPNNLFIRGLINSGLVKYNENNELIPKHDIYAEYYRKHFQPEKYIFTEGCSDTGNMVYCLINESKQHVIQSVIDKIQSLIAQKQFHSVHAILQSLFETSYEQILRQKLDKEQFYDLYLAYVLAAIQQSLNINSMELIKKLIAEVRAESSLHMQFVYLQALWEYALVLYENLDYPNAEKQLKEMLRVIHKLQRFGYNPNQDNVKDFRQDQSWLSYHDIMVADTLIRANKNEDTKALFELRAQSMLNSGFDYRYLSFTIRYALTLCTSNIVECLNMLKTSMQQLSEQYGINDKHYNWCGFHLNYFKMIYENRPDLLPEVQRFHQKMKENHYSNYRHRLNALAFYFYSIDEEILAHRYLLKESIFAHEIGNRQKAFQYLVYALNDLFNNNVPDALKKLRSVTDMLTYLPDYKRIVEHNIQVIQSNKFCRKNISYFFGDNLNDNTYYIDPRYSW